MQVEIMCCRPSFSMVKSSGHVLPYVVVACLGAILFGYHLGVVNDTLEHLAKDLGIAENDVLQGWVVRHVSRDKSSRGQIENENRGFADGNKVGSNQIETGAEEKSRGPICSVLWTEAQDQIGGISLANREQASEGAS
jgi:hypothetical protein